MAMPPGRSAMTDGLLQKRRACGNTPTNSQQAPARTWTSETALLGQEAPQGRKAELRPSVPAPPLGPPAASVDDQRSGHTRSGCGQFQAAVCSVCSGTYARMAPLVSL